MVSCSRVTGPLLHPGATAEGTAWLGSRTMKVDWRSVCWARTIWPGHGGRSARGPVSRTWPASSSSMSPASTGRPAASSSRYSPTPASSATMWVERITVMPLSATSAISSPVTSLRATGARFGRDVGGEDHVHAAVGALGYQLPGDLAAGDGVQVRQRFVQQQDIGAAAERDREGDLGALPAGQPAAAPLERHLEAIQPVHRPLLVPDAVGVLPELQHVGDGEVAVERLVLGEDGDPVRGVGRAGPAVRVNALPAGQDLTAGGRQQPGGDAHQRGLARAVGPDQRDDAVRGQLEAALAQRHHVAVALGQAPGLQGARLLAHAAPPIPAARGATSVPAARRAGPGSPARGAPAACWASTEATSAWTSSSSSPASRA